jgi:hypothetical protein
MKSLLCTKWLALLLTAAFTPATKAQIFIKPPRRDPAVPGQWVELGRRQAKHEAERDEIDIKKSFNHFHHIKFKVTDAPLRIYRVVVTYDNGVPDDLRVRGIIPQGGESPALHLRGAGTCRVKKIEFWYQTMVEGRGKADVTVYGMR